MAKNSDPPPLLLDTHIWVWLMSATGGLSAASRAVANEAVASGQARISTISFWEITMLASRNKLDFGKPAARWIAESLVDPCPTVEPLTTEIAIEAGELSRNFRSDPADLIIVATARLTGAALMTRDRRILDYAAAGHLNAIAA